MFQPGWLILRILHKSFEIKRPKGHWLEVVVHLYIGVFGRLQLLELCYFRMESQLTGIVCQN